MATTAKEEYEAELQRIRSCIQSLDNELVSHKFAFIKDPDNWGYVGDLRRIREALSETINDIKE